MDSLSQNWLWILIAVGVLAFFLFRGGHRSHGGFGHAGHGHGHDRDGTHDRPESAARQPPEAAIDPVSGAPVRTADSLTSVYRGQVYYFASKENRDRFEASPAEFATRPTGGIVDAAAPDRPHRRRHGC